MKLLVLISFFMGSVALAEADRYSDFRAEQEMKEYINYRDCLAGATEKCDCEYLKEQSLSLQSSLDKLNKQESVIPLRKCISKAWSLYPTVSQDGKIDYVMVEFRENYLKNNCRSGSPIFESYRSQVISEHSKVKENTRNSLSSVSSTLERVCSK